MSLGARIWNLHDTLFPRLDAYLEKCKDQPMDSASFSQYTPSGPFSVPQRKMEFRSHEEYVPNARFVDQMMYSCGSSAPRNFKKFKQGTKSNHAESGCNKWRSFICTVTRK